MPHKYYHGKTGQIWNVTKRAVGVEISKKVRAQNKQRGAWGRQQACCGRGKRLLEALKAAMGIAAMGWRGTRVAAWLWWGAGPAAGMQHGGENAAWAPQLGRRKQPC